MNQNSQLADGVMRFVSTQTGMPLHKVSLESRLVEDIGLAGDDATELFEAFADEFGIDPDSFQCLDFKKHFGEEGVPLGTGCLLMAILCPFAVPFFWITKYLDMPEWIAIPFTVLGLIAVLFTLGMIYSHFRRDDPSSIRVSDLVEAAQAKRWVARK